MTEYRLRATDSGFELAVAVAPGSELFVYEEDGSHGPVARLYGEAEKFMNARRAEHSTAFKRVSS